MSGSRGHPYRGPDRDVERRVERLEEEVKALAARIRRPYWERLDSPIVQLRQQLRAPVTGDEAAWLERERLLELYRDELAHAIGRAPELEARLAALPRRIDPSALGRRWAEQDVTVLLAKEWAGSRRAESQAERIAAWVGRIDPDARILRHRHGMVRVAPFFQYGTPLALEAQSMNVFDDVFIALVTPVPLAVGELRVQVKQWLHSLTTAVGLQRDTKTGDKGFDDLFLVTAEAESVARSLLTDSLRDALGRFAYHACPDLQVGSGVARLTWSYMFTVDLIERAVQILIQLRHARVAVRLID